MSSLWNRTKLYKQVVSRRLLGTSYCFVCGGSVDACSSLCDGCFDDLPRRPPQLKRKLEGVDEAWAAFRYEFPVTDVVQRAKFHGDLSALAVLASGFTDEFVSLVQPVDMIVPVPLLPWRFLRRGFNQSSELARHLGSKTGVAVRYDVVVRQQLWGRAQSTLKAAERRANMATAFRIKSHVSGKRIAVVDDIITTGATCAALASLLKSAGATRVIVVAAAATPLHRE